jgi:hypothetical protein
LEQLENMYDNAEAHAPWRDVAFLVGAASAAGASSQARLEAHRCVLAARCPYLAERFPAGADVELPGARFPPAALAALLRYCYTGRLAVAASAAGATAALLAQARLRPLADALRAEAASAPPRQQALALEPPRAAAKAELQAALVVLVHAATDAGAAAAALPPARTALLRAGAALLQVEEERFWVQPGFLCPRSEFFAALLGDRWRAARAAVGAEAAPPLRLFDMSPTAFGAALRWAYIGARLLLATHDMHG